MTQDSKGVAQKFSRNCKIPEEYRAKQDVLPTEYEQYLDYYSAQIRKMHSVQCMRTKLSGLNLYLQKSNIALCKISIEQVDHFLAVYHENHAPATCRVNRSYLRAFLKDLHQNGYIKKNLGPLVKSPPEFAHSKPPKFLRPKEARKLFSSLDLSVSKDLRTYATMHLAYYLGQVRVQWLCHLYDPMLLNDQVVATTNDQGVTNESISKIITNDLALPVPYNLGAQISF